MILAKSQNSKSIQWAKIVAYVIAVSCITSKYSLINVQLSVTVAGPKNWVHCGAPTPRRI